MNLSTFRAAPVAGGVDHLPHHSGPASEVRQVLAHCAEIEEASGRRFAIRPGRPDGPGLDPAGLVKGWSVDEAAMILRGHGLRDFSIDAGGDVLCVGTPPDGGRWRVGIRHPQRPDTAVAAVVEIESGAVATSGTYFRGEHIQTTGERTLASGSQLPDGSRVGLLLASHRSYADQQRQADRYRRSHRSKSTDVSHETAPPAEGPHVLGEEDPKHEHRRGGAAR